MPIVRKISVTQVRSEMKRRDRLRVCCLQNVGPLFSSPPACQSTFDGPGTLFQLWPEHHNIDLMMLCGHDFLSAVMILEGRLDLKQAKSEWLFGEVGRGFSAHR